LQLAGIVLETHNARAMASVLTTIGTGENRLDSNAGERLLHTSTDVPLFRFGLRQLLMFVAAVSTLLAAMVSSHGLVGLALLLASIVITMHVFATALGHRLQLRTEAQQLSKAPERASESAMSASERSTKLAAIRTAPRSPWHGRGSTYLPWLPRLVVGAMTLGGVSGALVLSGLIGHRTSLPGIIVGGISFAVLGGWISFLCGNFYGVFRHGFREALAEQRKDQPRGTVPH
jgi:hypothetical protein